MKQLLKDLRYCTTMDGAWSYVMLLTLGMLNVVLWSKVIERMAQ